MAVFGYTKGEIARYILLPQILPRIRELLGTGFAHLAFFMAQVYSAANIIPASHPYLTTGNIGKYGMLDVLSLASSHVKYDRKHIDQVAIFFAILAGIIILTIQCFLLLLSVFVGSASAATETPKNYKDFLITQNPQEDLAFRLMDRVFGIPDLFKSKDAPTAASEGFHAALHSLLQFYSIGLLVIAAIIIAYFIFAIVAETAETGTPFGKRFNHVWAPVRLVMALGLLIPIGYGLNSAQWITLYAAKWGSGFATNGWLLFSETLGEQYKILSDKDADALVHTPERPNLKPIVSFMHMAKTCKEATEKRHNIIIGAYLVKNVAEGGAVNLGGTSYDDAREFFNKTGNIYIRFGEMDQKLFPDQKGNVYPFCGEVLLPTGDTHRAGAKILNEFYFDLLTDLWLNDVASMKTYAQNDAWCGSSQTDLNKQCKTKLPPQDYADKVMKDVNDRIDKEIEKAVKAQRDEFLKGLYGEGGQGGTLDELKKFGWGGAGIYYNTVATMNGAIATSLNNAPYPMQMPFVMQYSKSKGVQQNTNQEGSDQFTPDSSSGRPVKWSYLGDEEVWSGINRSYEYWQKNITANKTENMIIDAINLMLGTEGLFSMCKNADVHPLAQLAGIGRGMLERATGHLLTAVGASLFGIGASATGMGFGALGAAASSFFVTFAMIGLMIGFLLYYVIPFMPFLYFFFAVTGWIKAIFEAMVGVPLWALAHLRIDGQGLPGDAATGGYYLILEIFLRPILIVFGLLAAISVFAALVRVLNEIFYLVVSNLTGFAKDSINLCGTAAGSTPPVGSAEYYRGPIDQFFFTIVYAIVVYLIGTSSFKMIDAVPNKILRWMGAGVNSFGDVQKDAGEGLLNKLSVGGYGITSNLQSAFSNAGSVLQDGNGQGLVSAATKAMAAVNPPPAKPQ